MMCSSCTTMTPLCSGGAPVPSQMVPAKIAREITTSRSDFSYGGAWSFDEFAALEHMRDPLQRGRVRERITVDDDEVSLLANFDRADLSVESEQARRSPSCGQNAVHRWNTRSAQHADLLSDGFVQVDSGAGRDSDASTVCHFDAAQANFKRAFGVLDNIAFEATFGTVLAQVVRDDERRNERHVVLDQEVDGLAIQVRAMLDRINAGPDRGAYAIGADGG